MATESLGGGIIFARGSFDRASGSWGEMLDSAVADLPLIGLSAYFAMKRGEVMAVVDKYAGLDNKANALYSAPTPIRVQDIEAAMASGGFKETRRRTLEKGLDIKLETTRSGFGVDRPYANLQIYVP